MPRRVLRVESWVNFIRRGQSSVIRNQKPEIIKQMTEDGGQASGGVRRLVAGIDLSALAARLVRHPAGHLLL